MKKRPLRLVASAAAAAKNPVPEMTPGDLLMRLAIVSPADYRAVIALARERYKVLWPFPEDVLTLKIINR